MSGITNGQSVDALNSNAAWIAKNGNDATVGILGLNETASATSGPPILNTQGAINVIIDAVGGNQTTPATGYGPLPANTITGLTHEQSLGVLARLFQASTGHSHTGVDGQGPLIGGVVRSIAASGSTALTGVVTISQGTGIVLNETGQNIQIAAHQSLADVLSVGNTATAGIDFSGGAIAGVSYEELLTSAFPPTYPAASHVWLAASGDSHLYLRTAASATHRVDSTLAASGSTALYGDITLSASGVAVLTQSGQNIQVYVPSPAASGSAVNSFAASGQTALTGAVTISASGGTVLTEAGQNVQIYSPPAVTIAASGSTALTGNVLLAASGGTVLTEAGQVITIYSPTGGGGAAGNFGAGVYHGHIDLSSTVLWNRSGSTFGDFTQSGSPVLTQDYLSGFTAPALAALSRPGIVITVPATGTIRVEFDVLFEVSSANVGSLQLSEVGSGNILDVSGGWPGSINAYNNVHLVGFMDVTASSTYTFKLKGKGTGGTQFIGGVDNSDSAINIKITYVK